MNKLLKNILLAGLSALLFTAIAIYTVLILKSSYFPAVTKIIFAVPLTISMALIVYIFINRIKILVTENSGKESDK